MPSSFLEDNQRWLSAWDRPSLRERRDAVTRDLQQALADDGGKLLRLHPVQLCVDPDELAMLGADVLALSRLQTRLVMRLLDEGGEAGVLAAFAVPPEMRRFVNWQELRAPGYLVGRYDLLHDGDGFRCCEANIDSCVAAAEIFDVAFEYMTALGIEMPRLTRPIDALASFVAERAAEIGAERIVILDTSSGGGSGGKGYLSFERFRAAIERHGAVPVVIANELSFNPAWLRPAQARRTFVHRGFMMQELPDGGAFLERLLDAGATVRSTYESEILSDKSWFALYHEALDAGLLSDDEAQLVRRRVPRTTRVTRGNAPTLIAAKNSLVFKACRSFGGADILIGDETSTAALQAALDTGRYVAQTLLQLPTLSLPHAAGLAAAPHHLVFGLYQYGDGFHGLLARCSTQSRIVNVSFGQARLAWALPLPRSVRSDIMARALEDRL
jgi:hypothetical protein